MSEPAPSVKTAPSLGNGLNQTPGAAQAGLGNTVHLQSSHSPSRSFLQPTGGTAAHLLATAKEPGNDLTEEGA